MENLFETEVSRLTQILGFKISRLRKISVSGTVVGPLLTQKIPLLHANKPKITVVGSVVVKTVQVGYPLYFH